MTQNRLNVFSIAAIAALTSAGSAMAAGIVANGGQTQVNTIGNTPVVNIAGANAAGISRNTFSNFDVDKSGVVFNNLTAAGASQLAGQLAANANLNGTAAKVIVADVTSAQSSKLNGAMEVAGAPAHLLIANAAGITVNGATTVNAPTLTLAAARFNPRADSPLALSVDTSRAAPATIEINGEGLDVGAGQLNLLSRATLVNAAVKGWTINSQNGTEFDGDATGKFSGKLTSNAAGVKPAVALDVSELGGMFANKIVLEGSEHGLGVNNAGLIKAGDGGLAVEMFGAGLTRQHGSMIGADGAMTVSDNAEIAALPDDQRPVVFQGLDDAQVFTLRKQQYAWMRASSDASVHYSQAEADALSDGAKVSKVAIMAAAAQNELAENRSHAGEHPTPDAGSGTDTGADSGVVPETEAQKAEREAAEQAARAEAERHAEEQAARDAQAEVDRKAWEAEQAAAAEQRAQEDAARQAAWDAEQQRMAEETAARDAQMEIDRKAWEAAQAAQAAEQAQQAAAQEAAYQADQQRMAEEKAARDAQMEIDRKAWEAAQAAQAAEQAQQAAAQEAAYQADQQRMAEEKAARDAQAEADHKAWEAAQAAQAAEQAQQAAAQEAAYQADQQRMAEEKAARDAQAEIDRKAWEAAQAAQAAQHAAEEAATQVDPEALFQAQKQRVAEALIQTAEQAANANAAYEAALKAAKEANNLPWAQTQAAYAALDVAKQAAWEANQAAVLAQRQSAALADFEAQRAAQQPNFAPQSAQPVVMSVRYSG